MSRTRLALALLLLLAVAAPAAATSITVTTTDDEINADGDCGLREAVRAANTNVAVDQCAAGSNTETDTIVVPAGIYTLTIVDDVNEQSLGGDLDVVDNTATEDLVIDGASAATTIIQACPVDQKTNPCLVGQGIRENVIENLAAHLTLQDLTIRNGFHTNGGGGGIWNVLNGVLTVRRCIVTDNNVGSNSFIGGGGLFCDTGACDVVDSTISNNLAFFDGGGIRNDSVGTGLAVLTVTNSTISGNTTIGAGGGIANLAGGTVTITNSTISDNTAGGAGGIFSFSGGPSFPMHLDVRSSTITNNTVVVNGSGKGGIETDPVNGFATLRNSIVAGNTDASTAVVVAQIPDCGGKLGSEGYNLIGNNAGCTFTASTGDQVGTAAAPQDAKLAALGTNGGPTETHLPLAGSPAIDGANPAAPGSGGFACPTTDQRGETRPSGDACDVGALEIAGDGSAIVVTGIKPNHAGNAASSLPLSVSGRVFGGGFVDGATVKLTRAGQADIVGSTAAVGAGGTVAAFTLDLANAAPGAWSVTVTNPDATSATLADAFTVESGGRAELWVELSMPRGFVFGRATTVQLNFGNRGTVDAYDVPIFLSVPQELEFHIPFVVSPPPSQAGQIATDWTIQAVDQASPSQENPDTDTFPLLLPVVPAGWQGVLRFSFVSPASIDAARNPATLTYDIGRPYYDPEVRAETVATLIDSAKQYAVAAHGTTTFPSDAAIEQYVRNQLRLVALAGATDVAAQAGGTPKVFSLTQLVVDTSHFIAGETEVFALQVGDDAPPTALASVSRWLSWLWPGAGEAEAKPRFSSCKPGDFQCEGAGFNCLLHPAFCLQPPMIICNDYAKVGNSWVYVPCDGKDARPPYLGSLDPNDKLGPNGPGGFVSGLTPIPYTVQFENKSNAGAAALEVTITDQLDTATLDLATFSLGPIGFGIEQVTPPVGLTSYTTDVDLRPGKDLLVRIAADLDAGTGIVTWTFTALDPETGELPEDPTNGFLPPNVTSPEGEGFVQFTVSPKPGLGLGTEICNDARIVFDLNAPIDTPEFCNVIGQPEDCGNCRDDDGDGQIDRADTDCVPAPADGGGVGLVDLDAAKALDKCAKGIRKTGTKLGATRTKLITACLKAVGDCVQLKPGDAKCLPAAIGKCTKAKTSLLAAETKGAAAIAKGCAAPAVAPPDLASVTGIGFAGEAGICAERGVAGVATLADVTSCIQLQHACATEHLIAAAVPRAGELLVLGGWDREKDLPCIDTPVNGGGAGVELAKRKALRKCDLAIQKAATSLGAGRTKALQACGTALFTCAQTKPNDGCFTKASGACTKALAGFGKLRDKFSATIGKACGVAPLVPGDLLAPEGLGVGALAATCARLDVPAFATVADVSSCLARQVSCRVDQSVRNETPRLDELLKARGIVVP